jgi:hypothetical protein
LAGEIRLSPGAEDDLQVTLVARRCTAARTSVSEMACASIEGDALLDPSPITGSEPGTSAFGNVRRG